MAARKKTKPAPRKGKKKKAPAKRAAAAARVKPPRVTAAPAELKELDSGWRSFIGKSVPEVPLTELWEAPKGAPSAKVTINKAALERAATRATTKTGKTKRKNPPKKPGATKKAPPKNAQTTKKNTPQNAGTTKKNPPRKAGTTKKNPPKKAGTTKKNPRGKKSGARKAPARKRAARK